MLLYADGRKAHVRAFSHEIKEWLAPRARVLGTLWLQQEPDPALLRTRPELVIVLGGDGSILGAARAIGERGWPTLGINLGRLGFLAGADRANWRDVLTRVFAGEAEVQRRTRIAWSIERGADESSTKARRKSSRALALPTSGLALNEALIARSSRGRLIVVQLELDERAISDYRGDGLLVSTPTGSTAYSLAAGGPLLDPTLEAFSVTPICPHQLTQRPLVVPAHLRVSLRLIEGEQATLSVDGQGFLPLRVGDAVHLHAAAQPLRWVALPGRGFYHRLRTTLGWGLGARGAQPSSS
ncbi:MAG: NAD(+)/NADH kinase [Planctomycetes bacterium]|nr:NAD(+)/NADH kinase [Planctomycetota bacterium]